VKYLFLLLFSLSLNLVAYEIDPCGNKWTKVVKHFKNLKSQQKFVDKYNKSNKWICDGKRAIEDIWWEEDCNCGYVSYWIKYEREK